MRDQWPDIGGRVVSPLLHLRQPQPRFVVRRLHHGGHSVPHGPCHGLLVQRNKEVLILGNRQGLVHQGHAFGGVELVTRLVDQRIHVSATPFAPIEHTA